MSQRSDDILNLNDVLGDSSIPQATDEAPDREADRTVVATLGGRDTPETDRPQDAIPAWLQRRREKSAGRTPPPLPMVRDDASAEDLTVRRKLKRQMSEQGTAIEYSVDNDSGDSAKEDAVLPWTERLRHWLKSEDAVGFAVSLVVHACLLLAMAVVILPQMSGDNGISVLLTEADGESAEAFEVIDTSIEPPGLASEAELSLPTEITAVTSPLAAPVDAFEMTAVAPSDGAELGAAEGEGSGGLIKLFGKAPGANAVTRGSFTVWTEPEDPRPGERYLILVRVKVPTELRRYPVRELSGEIVGTDNYRQDIPYSQKNPPPRPLKYLPVRNSHTQFTVEVPGASRLVRDRIEIRSELLDESQVIEIEF